MMRPDATMRLDRPPRPIPETAAVATYPVTVHLPSGQREARAGSWAELWVSVAHPNAEGTLVVTAINWSQYLRNYCGLELEPVSIEHTVRDDQPVLLARTMLRVATRSPGGGE